ncbi:multidrug efflux SMR transporter [Cytobacillus sp. FSL W7-1323]|uniref:QacE family quaternary ammonium compound efflux SMR transporter n=1 Tax=Cytobacillus kochii TaxID=859143 RepID=A0A248TE92_9BACI|nr:MULTISPECIES: multidrug efflux SMR transporter [Cytobacillus]ASV66442.1 QacE family quaternary ammonium compound efflux SMR transporter [Cytobacillus kochii]MDQ0187111.1 paired small multidrug resistance pump [Cytobacillus kochii]MEA1854440.1 multidrug efflux SMR transporter [Cytobacillus sp. OWB-43]MED1605412.1 multidrug efflux SMR transporter [Cytobacillus kochii]
MYWIALVVAGCFEVLGVYHLKKVADKQWKSIIFLALSFAISFSLLSFAMTDIAMGTAYAIWTGIGTVGAAIVGMVVFNEPREWKRLVCIALILGAAIGLKLIS